MSLFRDEQETLFSAIKSLENQRAVLRLRYVHGLASKEIAERLGKSDGSVRVMLARSRVRLREVLKDE